MLTLKPLLSKSLLTTWNVLASLVHLWHSQHTKPTTTSEIFKVILPILCIRKGFWSLPPPLHISTMSELICEYEPNSCESGSVPRSSVFCYLILPQGNALQQIHTSKFSILATAKATTLTICLLVKIRSLHTCDGDLLWNRQWVNTGMQELVAASTAQAGGTASQCSPPQQWVFTHKNWALCPTLSLPGENLQTFQIAGQSKARSTLS